MKRAAAKIVPKWLNFKQKQHRMGIALEMTFNDDPDVFKNNRRITIREVVHDVGLSFSSCQAIFTDVLRMKRAAAKIVPKFLNFEQKQHRINIALEI